MELFNSTTLYRDVFYSNPIDKLNNRNTPECYTVQVNITTNYSFKNDRIFLSFNEKLNIIIFTNVEFIVRLLHLSILA